MITYYLVIVSMPYFNHPFWSADFGGGFTAPKMLGAVSLLYSIIYLASKHDIPRFFASPQSKWMAAFFGIALYSYVTHSHATTVETTAMSPMLTYASTFLFFFITMVVIDSVQRLYWSLMVAVGSVGFASLYMLREWQRGMLVYGGGFRPGWIVGDANYFTVAALAVLPIGFELLLVAYNKWHKAYCLGCIILIFLAIVLGASRGGFLGIFIDTAYLIFRSRQPVRNLARISALALPFLLLAPNSPLHRFLSPDTGDSASVTQHLAGWEAGLTMIKKNPMTGVGIGNYKPTVIQYNSVGLAHADPHIAHNGFLEVAAEMGLPAFVVFLIFFGTTFYSIRKTERLARARDQQVLAAIALGMQAALLGVWVAIIFVSGEYTKLFWLILCMTMAMPALVPARASAAKEPPARSRREPEPETEPAFKVGEALVELR